MHGLSPWLGWIADSEFWTWVRTVLGTLAGIALGAWLQRRAQRAAAAEARLTQKKAAKEQRRRDAATRSHDDGVRIRTASEKDVRKLHEELTDLHRTIASSKPTVSEIVNNSWGPRWRTIWTPERSARVDVLADLVPDRATRKDLRKIVRVLDVAEDISRGSAFPRPLFMHHHRLVEAVVSRGILVVNRYLRGEQFVDDGKLAFAVERAREYRAWEREEFTRAAEEALRELPSLQTEARAPESDGAP